MNRCRSLANRTGGWRAQAIAANLRAVFAEADNIIPFDVLVNYLAGAQAALVQ